MLQISGGMKNMSLKDSHRPPTSTSQTADMKKSIRVRGLAFVFVGCPGTAAERLESPGPYDGHDAFAAK